MADDGSSSATSPTLATTAPTVVASEEPAVDLAAEIVPNTADRDPTTLSIASQGNFSTGLSVLPPAAWPNPH